MIRKADALVVGAVVAVGTFLLGILFAHVLNGHGDQARHVAAVGGPTTLPAPTTTSAPTISAPATSSRLRPAPSDRTQAQPTVPTIPIVSITIPAQRTLPPTLPPPTQAPTTRPAPTTTVAPTTTRPPVPTTARPVPTTARPVPTTRPKASAANLVATPQVKSALTAAAVHSLGPVQGLQPGHTYYGVDNTTGFHWAAAVVDRAVGKTLRPEPHVFEQSPGGTWAIKASPASPGSDHCTIVPPDVLAVWGVNVADCSALAPAEKPVPLPASAPRG